MTIVWIFNLHHSYAKIVFSDTKNATRNVYQTILALGSHPFLLRARTSVTVGHVAPIVRELTRICPKGGVVKCQIVTVVGMMQYCTKGFKATESRSHFVITLVALCHKKEMDSRTKYSQ